MKSRRNYFEEIKNNRVEDKLIEHLIRLLFFTIVIGIGSIYQRLKESMFHMKNFFLSRNMSDILAKYRKYRESVHSVMEKTVHSRKLHIQIHDAINTHFTEYESRIIFGLKGSRDSIVNSSKKILTSVRGYTRRVGARYFEYIPEFSVTEKISSSLIHVQMLRRSGKKSGYKKELPPINETFAYLNSVAQGYRRYMTERFEKFYTEDFMKKISGSSKKMKTVRRNIEKITETVRRAEQKRAGYRFGESSN